MQIPQERTFIFHLGKISFACAKERKKSSLSKTSSQKLFFLHELVECKKLPPETNVLVLCSFTMILALIILGLFLATNISGSFLFNSLAQGT